MTRTKKGVNREGWKENVPGGRNWRRGGDGRGSLVQVSWSGSALPAEPG